MKGKIKCLSLSVTLIGVFIALLAFPTYAADYGVTFPQYVNQSGGSFIECQTNLGKGTIIVPVNYKIGYFGFYGNTDNIMNITNSTLSGQFVLANGKTYPFRVSGFATCQYQDTDDYYTRYYDLTITKIYNTNVSFTDEKGDRGNIITDFKPFEIAMISLFTIHCCYDFVTLFFKKRS